MTGNNDKESNVKLIEYVKELIQKDQEFREKYQVGDKYRTVSNRLKSLLHYLEKNLDLPDDVLAQKVDLIQLAADEALVYVYLFNVSGQQVRRWAPMVTASNLYEYSVNRPIYGDENHVRALIRSKARPEQHAYLTVKVKKSDIAQTSEEATQHDALNYPLMRLKEGALYLQNVVSLTHEGSQYVLGPDGQLELNV